MIRIESIVIKEFRGIRDLTLKNLTTHSVANCLRVDIAPAVRAQGSG